MTDKLTVLIPVKDERRNIRECIESVRKIADEILVADSLSTDNTLDIVREIGNCRIIEREFVNYSDFKNWAIPQAEHTWVLIVDADERITDELAQDIRRVLANPPSELDGFWIERDNFFMGHPIRHCGWNSDAVFRLIRRDVCRYRDVRVHEEIDIDPQRAGKLRGKFRHYTYWSYDQFLRNICVTPNGAPWTTGSEENGPDSPACCFDRCFDFFSFTFCVLAFSTACRGFRSVCLRRFSIRLLSRHGSGNLSTRNASLIPTHRPMKQ